MDNQKTTSIRLKSGDAPVNPHTKTETAVVTDESGTNILDTLADFEARIAALEA